MLDFDLIKLVLISGIASSIITTATVQKIKENLSNKKWLGIISFVVSMVIGTLFSYSFSELTLAYDMWVGFITFIGADTLYKTFEDKIFTPFSDMQKVTTLERSDLE